MIQSIQRTKASPNPEEITCLELHLQSQLGSRVRNLSIEPSKEGLVLKGTTRTYYAKQLVQEALMEATRYHLGGNEIEVV